MLWLLLLLARGTFSEKSTAETTVPDILGHTTGIQLDTSFVELLAETTEPFKNASPNTIGQVVTEVTTVISEERSDARTMEPIVSSGNDAILPSSSVNENNELVSQSKAGIGRAIDGDCFQSLDACTAEDLMNVFNGEARFLANPFVLEVPLFSLANATTEFIKSPRMAFGKSPFLTGFGLGFLAFGLKKLLLPFFIGAQIVKSVLVALFLPTLLGHIGKLVGKGLTSVASQSGSSGGTSDDQVAEFDFKDTGGGGAYGDVDAAGSDTMSAWTAPAQSNAHATLAALNPGRTPSASQNAQDRPLDSLNSYLIAYARKALEKSHHSPLAIMHPNNKFKPLGNRKINSLDTILSPQSKNVEASKKTWNPYKAMSSQSGNAFATQQKYTPRLPSHQIKQHYGSFYSKDPQSDFKVFNKIPSSSQLLTHYDPFYSPLLSRLDSVFKQLGTTSESCRERLVCDMYRNPAKFAPFSNLVSAQLSRELNELRKPSSDNPEILRFFRYMKAAKDGQDGLKCENLHNSCIAPTIVAENASPMVTTFNDINKLVQARKLNV